MKNEWKLVDKVTDAWVDRLGEEHEHIFDNPMYAKAWFIQDVHDMNDGKEEHEWMKSVTLYLNGKVVFHSEREKA